MSDVFFSTNGMTSTESSYYANIAKELQEAAAEKLNSLRFFNTSVAVIGSDNKQLMSMGYSDLAFIESCLQEQSSMFSFCAWVREAIKAKEEMQNKVNHTTFEEWLEKEGIEIPSCDYPKSPELKTEQDVLDSWDINKLTKYLRLETFASHYGKLIHPNGAYSKARKDAYNAINNPITKEGTGRDIILYYKEPSVSIRSVDSVFLKLQDTYRGYEKELNRMKAEVKDTVNELNRKAHADYLAKVEEWRVLNTQNEATRNELYQKFQNWKSNELERISKLKITIPDSLKDTFKIIKEVGDTSK